MVYAAPGLHMGLISQRLIAIDRGVEHAHRPTSVSDDFAVCAAC